MTSPRCILVIDDDPSVRFVIKNAAPAGYVVEEADSGRDGLQRLFTLRPSLIVLDLGLPDLHGRAVLQRVRELADTPVIMLTAVDGEHEIVAALNLGADEYVTKPFGPAALWARIEAILRRAARSGTSTEKRLSLDGGNLVIDQPSSRVWVRGTEVSLTATEFRLLHLLATHANEVLSQELILTQIWGNGYEDEDGYVPTYIRRLRTKIEADPRRPAYLVARRGLGYMLVSEPSEAGT